MRGYGGAWSTGQRTVGYFCWRLEIQGLTGLFVEFTGDGIELHLAVAVDRLALGEVLAKQSVGVLVGARAYRPQASATRPRRTSANLVPTSSLGPRTAAFALGELGAGSARDRIREVALDPSEPEGVRLSAITAPGRVAGDYEGVMDLTGLAQDDGQPIASAAADALGRASFEELALLPRTPIVDHALARVAAERGILLFDGYYVDSSGGLHTLPAPAD